MHYNFTTPENPLVTQMMVNGKVIKMHQSGKQQLMKFRIQNFGFFRITFTQNRNFSTLNFPLIEVRNNEVDFARHLKNGVANSKKKFPYDFTDGATYDFFMVTNGPNIKFGIYKERTYKTIGYFSYLELDTLSYVGFSTEMETVWIIEEGIVLVKFK